ncbi:Rib/alpha-like domain-containing protein, partial [Rothia nasimurium]|uniref:Rib/alpha-like domain-containing protein n=1 Tax=Rothia nasimurium TaxID=85336 RepID=UPI001F28357A
MAPKYTADKATLLDYKKKLKCGIATLGAGIIVASSVGLGTPASFAAELPVDGRTVIDTGTTQTDARNSVNGYVTYNRNGNPNNRDVDNAVPMEGVIVYAQWFEKDGTASPIYKGTTGADGSFHIVMKPYQAPDGSTKSFDADALLPEGEKFRIWAVNPDSSTYDLLFQYMNGQVGPETYIFDTGGGASYDLGPNRLNNINIQFADVKDPDGMHNVAAATDNAKEGLDGNIDGKVFWNNRLLAGGLDYGTLSDFNNGDVPAAGVNVYGSYLSDAGIAKIMAEAPAAIGTSNIRGFRWTMQNEADLQAWIKQQIATDGKDFWIAETAHAVTDANGDYSLQFNGTYGTSWDNVGTFADANANALKGTVAASPSEGRWATSAGDISRLGSTVSKHINKDWLFISTERTEGISQITEWRNNWYMGPSANFGVNTLNYNSLRNADFALQPEQISFDVTPYDSYDNYGVAGDTVQTTTTGLPGAFLSNMQYEIEWTDQDGKVVKPGSECRFNVSSTGTIPSCDFKTPKDLTKQTTYVAKLYAVNPDGNRASLPLAQDSFTVDPNKKLTDGLTPTYGNTLVVPGTPATSTPTITDTDGNPTTAPEGTKYSIPADYTPPAGYTVTIDETTGVVTVTSPNSPNGDTAETLDVPVLVTYPDSSTDKVTAPFQLDTDGDGTPDVTDEDDDNDGFTDQEEKDAGSNPKDDQSTPDTTAPVVDPIDDQTGTVGEPITPITVTTDDPTAKVEVSGLPDGVTYDPATGEITGIPTTPGTSTVTVTVTDPNGNTTTEEFTFTVSEAPVPPVDPVTPITDENDPSYPDTGLPQGEFLIVETPTNPNGSALPDGTTFTGGEGNPSWATINPDGTVTLNPGTDVTPGKYPVEVIITYPDGSTDKVTFNVTVTEVTTPPVDPVTPITDENDPSYPDTGLPQGEFLIVETPTNPNGSALPD